MATPSYNDIVHAVLTYYDSGTDFWTRVNNGTASAAEIYDAYSRLPQLQVTRNLDGVVMGLDWKHGLDKLQTLGYADPSEGQRLTDELNQMFSNISPADYGEGNSYNVNIPSNWGGNGTDGYIVGPGASGAGGLSLATIADKASLGITGVNIGAKLGAAIDSAIYSIDPAWWDTHYPTINPETWPSIAGNNESGKAIFRTLFGIRDTGVTGYVDERVLAQTYQMLRDLGVFDTSGESYSQIADTSVLIHPNQAQPIYFLTGSYTGYLVSPSISSRRNAIPSDPNAIGVCVSFGNSSWSLVYFNRTQFTLTEEFDTSGTKRTTASSVTNNGQTFWYARTTYINEPSGGRFFSPSLPTVYRSNNTGNNVYWDIAKILFDGTHTTPSPVEGIRPIGQSYPYPPTNITGTTLNDVLTQLKQQYPDLFTDSITESVLQDDGSVTDTTYVPVPWAVNDLSDSPVTSDEVTENVKPDAFTEITTSDPTNNPPDTGTGNQSPYVAPTGSASSLWAVYHPSQAQLNAFGAWLWSSDFVEQLKRLFNDPMQAIIGVHKVFAPIPTGGSQNIKCGYLDSGVSSPTVSSQYTEVNCGTVNCREYFGNVFDYDPHTRVSIYLPFIGVVPLKVSEVMRASITVTYGVDVITGACLAKVKVDRDDGGAILYSFGGSCACHYPISAGSYAGIISGIVTSAVGVAGGIMSGNPLAAVGGVVAGARQAHTEVQHSGGFTGCAGAMGPKIPYLIITRPQTRVANDVQLYEGKPSNATQFIGDCSGFVRATEVHFSSQAAFDDEAKEVEALLKSGVLISD